MHTRSGSMAATPNAPTTRSSRTSRPRTCADLRRAARRARRPPGAAGRAVERRVASRRVQRGEQQAARARRGDEPQRAVDGGLVEAPAGTEVQHRRLGQAAGVLVGARDDEVRAGGQRVLRERVAEGQVRAPRLVDHERHAVGVRNAGEAGDVGRGAVVGRRDDDGRRRVGRAGQRRVERGGQHAVREAELDVDLGSDEGRAQPREDEAVDRAAVDGALHDDARRRAGRWPGRPPGCPARRRW